MTEHLPPRDRRQRKRILTLRNTAWGLGILLLALGAFSIWNELNQSADGLALVEERKRKIENDIVREATPFVVQDPAVTEHDPREPLWVEKPRKEEILGVEDPRQTAEEFRLEPLGHEDQPAPALSFRGSDAPFLEQRSTARKSRVKISGSGSSLTLETSDDG